MNRTFLIFLMVATALIIAVIGNDETTLSTDAMPWNIQRLDNGSTRVFDITLGKTNIQDAHQILATFSETRLFTVNDQLELRAHFDEFSLGGLLTEIELIYDLPQNQLKEIQQRAISTEHEKYQTLSDEILMELLTTPIKQIVYRPSIDYDYSIISQRFGEPARRESINETSERLFYPDFGLVILLNNTGRDQFLYSQPEQIATTDN